MFPQYSTCESLGIFVFGTRNKLVSIEQVQFYIVEVASRLPVTRVLSVSK